MHEKHIILPQCSVHCWCCRCFLCVPSSYVNVPIISCCFWIKGPGTASERHVKHEHQNERGLMQPGKLLFTAGSEGEERCTHLRAVHASAMLPCWLIFWPWPTCATNAASFHRNSGGAASPDTVFARHPCGAAPWLNDLFLLIASINSYPVSSLPVDSTVVCSFFFLLEYSNRMCICVYIDVYGISFRSECPAMSNL